MPNPYVDAYLRRRRELEVDRNAKEQFDREMQYRDATLNQQRQFHMETLAAQQAEQQAVAEARAKEFAAEMDYKKSVVQQQREFDLAGMAAKGEIRAPQNIEVPMAPGSINPTLQGMPGGQVKEPGINFAGQNLVFTSPEERAEKVADVEEGVDERRRQRRLADLEKLHKSGQIPEQIYQIGKVSMLMGQQPAQPAAEASYIFHNEAAAKALEAGDNKSYNSHVRLAAQAKDWMEAKRQAVMPYGFMAQQDAYDKTGQYMRAAAKEMNLQKGKQLSVTEQRNVITRARQKAIEAGDKASVQALDTVLGLPQAEKEVNPLERKMNEIFEKAFAEMEARQAGRGAAGR